VWSNAAAKKYAELEAQSADPAEILNVVAGANTKRMYEEGDLDAGVLSCGQGVGLAHDIPSMQELFDRMMAEAQGVVNRFAAA
jgi:nitronate monooxygenase